MGQLQTDEHREIESQEPRKNRQGQGEQIRTHVRQFVELHAHTEVIEVTDALMSLR